MVDKVGILTLSSAENYGAVLQCYSLCEYINENFMPAEIIDYTPEFIVGRYKWINVDKSGIYRFFRSLVSSILTFPLVFIKKTRFYKFKKNGRYSSRRYKGAIYDDEYKYYIVGSDQVWNLELTHFEKTFFLDFCHDKNRKNAYAASIGVNKLNDVQIEFYKKFLPEFNNISVREITGKSVLNLIDASWNIESNIDPVFLHDKQYWSKEASVRLIKDDYILIYAFVGVEEAVHLALNYGNYPIYIISNGIRNHFKDVKNIRCVGPRQFLSLIEYAKYIITDSFHGTAFSIIFEKEFKVIKYPDTSSRMVDLLKLCGLQDRMNLEMPDNNTIDFEKIADIIQLEVFKSNKYLSSILKES